MQSSLPQQLALRRLFRPRPIQAFLRACERWLVRRVDQVACSTGLESHVRAIAPDKPVHEWRYPLQARAVTQVEAAALRARLGIPPDAWVAMYSGTFEPYQGLDDIVAALPLAAMAIPELSLVLIGASDVSARSLEQRAVRAGVAHRLRVLPRCGATEIPAYHAMANVLLAPRASGSNLPLKVFHYMGAGRPILATGAPDEHGVLGSGRALIVEHEARAVAGAIVRLHREPEFAAGLAREAGDYASRALAPHHFEESVQAVCDRFHRTPAPMTSPALSA
jgi:colanic acid biosynthesis glycosyl transferase WcaI